MEIEDWKKVYEQLTTGFDKKVEEGRKKCSMYEPYDENCNDCAGFHCPYDIFQVSGQIS